MKQPNVKLHYTFVGLALAAGFVVLGLIGHQDMVVERIENMSNVCQTSYRVISGELENECGRLIDEVQADGKFEVVSRNGQFWAELKEVE